MIIWIISGCCSLCYSRTSYHWVFGFLLRGSVGAPAWVRIILVDVGRARVTVAVGLSWIHHVRKSIDLWLVVLRQLLLRFVLMRGKKLSCLDVVFGALVV